jgi:hypothetical protein
VFSRTSGGGDHGLPWIMASKVPLSKATVMLDVTMVDGRERTSPSSQLMDGMCACRADMVLTTTLEKSMQSCDV